MHVISRQALRDFWMKHPDAETSLRTWFTSARRATWRNLDEVQEAFPHADAVGQLTVFNISGNKYRLITRMDYETGKIFIRRVLRHQDYSRGRWKE